MDAEIRSCDRLKNKVVTPMVNILKSGATPEGIALSLAFGFTGGLFPVPATTTVMCVIFVFLFKLNIGAVQIANLLMTPVNLATFITFIRYGEALFGAAPVELSTEAFKSDPIAALGKFWVSLCYGIVAWAIFVPPATFALYVCSETGHAKSDGSDVCEAGLNRGGERSSCPATRAYAQKVNPLTDMISQKFAHIKSANEIEFAFEWASLELQWHA